MSSSRSPSAVKAGSELLRRYRDEKGRGDAREGGELHNILFGNEEDNLTAPSSPFYSSSAEAAASTMSFTPRAAKASTENEVSNLEMRTPGVTQPSETSNRTLLKVYMANQLELNEADMESYEAVVNELAEQLTEVTKIKDELAVSISHLHYENDQAIRERTEQWAKQKAELVSQIEHLQGALSETDMLFIDVHGALPIDFTSRSEYVKSLRSKALQADAKVVLILQLEETVKSLRADYRTMQVSRDGLHVQLSDFKEQMEYKQLVAQTVDVALEEEQRKVKDLETKCVMLAKESLAYQMSAHPVPNPSTPSVRVPAWESPRAVGGSQGGFIFEDSPMSVGESKSKDDNLSPGPGGMRGGASASTVGRRNDNLRMQMQLDLDETEACHFENMANGLLEKIGRITEERDGLQILFEQVQREREGLLASIEELKMESQIKDEEVQRASDLLDDMQDKIAERDLIIQRIKAERDEAVALIDNEHSRDRGYDVPAIGDDALLKQLQVAEERLQNYELLLQGKNDEVAFAEASLVEIQTLFEEARRGLPHSAKGSAAATRITHRGESTPGSTIAPIPFNLSAEGAEMWGALHDGEGNAIKGTRGRESGGRREAGNLRSDSLIEATEQELIDQASELASLKISLSEEKEANEVLKEQKAGLKKMMDMMKERLAEVDEEMERLSSNERLSANKVEELVDLLRLEVSRNDENGRAMECIENLLSSSQQEAQSLQSTVATQNAQLLTLENAMKSQKSPFPTPEVLQDLETVLKIKVLESFKSELQIENDNLLAKCKSKAQRVEELTAQTVALKGELDAREADFIVYQSRNGVDAADKDHAMQLEADIANLREISELQEARCIELNAMLGDRDQTLEISQDESRFLRDVLSKVSEKDEATNRHLQDVKESNSNLSESLHRATLDLQAKKLESEDNRLEKERLHRIVLETITEAEEKERMYELNRFHMESEIALKTLQLNGVEGDVRSHVSVLTLRLEDMMGEKCAAEDALRKEKQAAAEAHREQSKRASELAQAQRYVTTLVETIQYYSGHFHQQEEQLARHVQSWALQCDEKIKHSLDQLHTVKKAVAQRHSGTRAGGDSPQHGGGMTNAILEEKLFFAQASLTAATRNTEQQESEHKNLWQQLQQSLRDQERLERALKDSRQRNTSHRDRDRESDSIRDRDSGFGPVSQAGGDEFNRLSERLIQAETRAVQMSTISAKSFAQSARTIAYLEGECGRLKTMLDHFRLVNDKMMCDIRIAREEGMNQKCLEHRLKLTVENEGVLQERLRITEGQLRAKERDSMLSLQQIREQGEIREDDIKDEIAKLTEKSRQMSDKLTASAREITLLTERLETQKESNESEQKKLLEKLDLAESSLQDLGSKCRESDQLNKSLRSVLREKEDVIAESEGLLTQKRLEQNHTSSEFLRKSSQFAAESVEHSERIRTLEAAAVKTRAHIAESDASNLLKDELLSSALAKQVTSNEEARAMRTQLDSQQIAVTTALTELQETRSRLVVETRNATDREQELLMLQTAHQAALADLSSTKHSSRLMEDEIEVVRSELRGTTGELLSYRESLDCAEGLITTLQNDLLDMRTLDHTIQLRVESLDEENVLLKQALQSLKDRLASTSNDVQALQQIKGIQEEEKDSQTKRVRDLEMTLLEMRSTVTSFSSAEADLCKDMEKFFKSLDSTGTSAAGHALDVDTVRGEDTASSLFASPIPGPAPFSYTPAPAVNNQSSSGGNADLSMGEVTSSLPLITLRKQFQVLKGRGEGLSHRCSLQEDSLKASRKEFEESKMKIITLEQTLQKASHEKQVMQSRLTHSDQDLLQLRSAAETLSAEKELVTSGSEDVAQRVRSFVRDIDGLLSDALSRSHTATGGKIIMRSDIGVPGGAKSSIGGSLLAGSPNQSMAASSSLSGSALEIAANTMLPSCACDIERALDVLCNALEAVTVDTLNRRETQDTVTTEWVEKEKHWFLEKAALVDQIAKKEDSVRDERVTATGYMRDLALMAPEIEKQKELLAEFARNNVDLEIEYKAAAENNGDLRTALSEAESLCMDLRGRMRALQVEDEKKASELEAQAEQLQAMRKKNSDHEFQIEKASAAADRLRAEREAMDNVRRSVEGELDRCRIELSGLRTQARDTEQDGQAAFEVEKLLGALKTTMDQLSASIAVASSSGSSAPTARSSPFTKPPTQLEDSSNSIALSLSVRVDSAVTRLGELRSWAREDAKIRRSTEEKLLTQEQDIAANQAAAEDVQKQLRKALSQSSEREVEIREKMKEITELRYDSDRKDEEIEKLRKEDSSLGGTLEIERRSRQKQLAELHARDGELMFLRSELEGQKNGNTKTLNLLSELKARLQEASEEVEEKGEQLRVVKAHNLKLNVTLEQLERGSEADNRDRVTLEKRVVSTDSMNSVISALKSQLGEAEDTTRGLREQLKGLVESKIELEARHTQALKDIESNRKVLHSSEIRHSEILKEKSALVSESFELRSALAKAKDRTDHEYTLRLQTESNVETLKRASNENRLLTMDYTEREGRTEMLYVQGEEEKKTLRSSLVALQSAYDEKERARLSEIALKQRAEADLVKYKAMMEKANFDLSDSTARAKALRTEGRKARKQILECVSLVRDMVYLVQLDSRPADRSDEHSRLTATLTGVGGMSPIKMRTSAFEDVGDSEKDKQLLGLCEALGMSELSSAVEGMKELIPWLRDTQPKLKIEQDASMKRLEGERNRLVKDLANAELKGEDKDKNKKQRDEMRTLENQLLEARRREVDNSLLLSRQITTLEEKLTYEKELKQTALADLEKSRLKSDSLSKEIESHKSSPLLLANQSEAQRSETLSAYQEIDRVRREAQGRESELRAVEHHRDVLRDTIEQLERQVRLKTDALADAMRYPHSVDGTGVGGSEEEEVLRRQIARYHARCSGMDELVSSYRAGVLALYADGSSYGAAQYAPFIEKKKTSNSSIAGVNPMYNRSLSGSINGTNKNSSNFKDIRESYGGGTGWIEREIHNIKRSYEEEIKLLEAETGELRGKLRQSGSYISELRKRFEDNMKAMYRPAGRGQASETLALQFEHMSSSLEQAHAESQRLDKELSTEKTLSRRRHGLLVDDLTAALKGRDAAMCAVGRLEVLCIDNGIDKQLVSEAAHIDERDKDGGRDRADEMYPRTSSTHYATRHDEGNASSAHDERKALQLLMRGLAESDADAEADRRNNRKRRDLTQASPVTTKTSAPNSADKARERESEQERRETETRDRERAQLDKLKEERDRNKANAARHREGGSGSMVALTAHAHSSHGRESYTPLAPGVRSTGAVNASLGEFAGDRPTLTNLFSPAMRYISPMKSVTVQNSPAPFVVRHATSDFISMAGTGSGSESRGVGSPSVSYPLNTVRSSELGGGSMRISRSTTQTSSIPRKISTTVTNKKD